MRRVIPILIFILILIFKQVPSAVILDHLTESSSIFQEASMIISTQGLGWFENMEKGDAWEIPPVFQAFQNKERTCIGSIVLKLFRFSCHYHDNPLLIDRPPPASKA